MNSDKSSKTTVNSIRFNDGTLEIIADDATKGVVTNEITIGPLGWIQVNNARLRIRHHWNGPISTYRLPGNPIRRLKVWVQAKMTAWRLDDG